MALLVLIERAISLIKTKHEAVVVLDFVLVGIEVVRDPSVILEGDLVHIVAITVDVVLSIETRSGLNEA